MSSGSFIVVLLAVGSLVVGHPAPQSVKLGAGEVGASFGGYSASAGLGGLLGGGRGSTAGGLHAEAGKSGGPAAAAGLGGLLGGGGGGGGGLYSGATTGGGGPAAAAGLGGLLGGGGGGGGLYSGATTGGGKLYSGASGGSYGGGFVGGKYVSGAGVKGGFYDRIFDIPISTLRAVNRFLTEGGAGVSKSASFRANVRARGGPTHVGTKTKFVSKQFVAPPPRVYSKHGGGVYASAYSSGAAAGGTQGAGFYDNVFNIPISVLESVNRLLSANHRR